MPSSRDVYCSLVLAVLAFRLTEESLLRRTAVFAVGVAYGPLVSWCVTRYTRAIALVFAQGAGLFGSACGTATESVSQLDNWLPHYAYWGLVQSHPRALYPSVFVPSYSCSRPPRVVSYSASIGGRGREEPSNLHTSMPGQRRGPSGVSSRRGFAPSAGQRDSAVTLLCCYRVCVAGGPHARDSFFCGLMETLPCAGSCRWHV